MARTSPKVCRARTQRTTLADRHITHHYRLKPYDIAFLRSGPCKYLQAWNRWELAPISASAGGHNATYSLSNCHEMRPASYRQLLAGKVRSGYQVINGTHTQRTCTLSSDFPVLLPHITYMMFQIILPASKFWASYQSAPSPKLTRFFLAGAKNSMWGSGIP